MSNEKRDWGTLFIGSGSIISIGSFVLNIIGWNYSFITLCGSILGVILVCLGFIINKMDQANDREKTRSIIEKNKKEMSEWFDSKIVEYDMNVNDVISTRKKVRSIYISQKYYYWIKDKKISFFPQKESFLMLNVTVNNSVEYCEANVRLISVNISDIEYFKPIGDISYVTNVESTGVNVKGAAIGAVVAGDAGAIIGSRPKITSKVEEKDNRYVELKYKDNGTIKTLEFDYTALSIFRNLFPEKEFEYVNFKSENLEEKNVTNDITSTLSLEEKFEKLRSLKNSGLITEEEFSDKKKELLKQI